MTRDEAIGNLIYAKQWKDRPTDEAFDMAINALEQESVLDKIRAEIVQIPTISFNANDIYKADVLAIIDKYKTESEKHGV